MADSIRYFAYGANMSAAKMQARVPGAIALGGAVLQGYELRFHKRSCDGSGKCDAHRVNRGEAVIHGVLFVLPRTGKPRLDRFEGLGAGYEESIVQVVDRAGRRYPATTYLATDVADGLLPYCWYRHHVLTGAREFNLPCDYIQSIADMHYLEDPDVARRTREMAIYRD